MRNIVGRTSGASSERGSALIAALFVVLMVGALSMAFLQMSMNKNREQQGAADAKRAFYMAESGISEAYSGLVRGKSGNVGSDVVPARFGNGVFWVVAENLGSNKTCLTSTGLCGSGRASISLVVENKRPTIASQGVFSQNAITIQAGAVIDSFDSRLSTGGMIQMGGPEAPTNQARVGSNGNATVQGTTLRAAGAQVLGDVRPGPGGVVGAGTGAVITGSTAPGETSVVLPPVRFPDVAQSGDVNYGLSTPPLALTGQTGYHALKLSGVGRATLTGPLELVVDSLVLGAGTRLTINAANGPVKIYVRDWLKLAPGSTVVCSSTDPTKIAIACDGSATVDRDGDGIVDAPVTVGATSSFYGYVYAPKASVTLANTFTLWGAIATNGLTVAGGGRIHFDRAFVDLPSDEGADPEHLCWRLVQLPPARLVESRADPLTYLRAQSITPVASKDAHYDVGDVPATSITKTWSRVAVAP
ncbi:MAG: hypothetical protein HZA53_08465 [Planctomycetes bacterium]|nr:hypothetical protein [Planctomycetota bacterium]